MLDDDGVASAIMGATPLTAVAKREYILAAGFGIIKVFVTDLASNHIIVDVEADSGHFNVWQSENGKSWKKCMYCSMMWLWVALLLACGAGVADTMIYGKRKTEKQIKRYSPMILWDRALRGCLSP